MIGEYGRFQERYADAVAAVMREFYGKGNLSQHFWILVYVKKERSKLDIGGANQK